MWLLYADIVSKMAAKVRHEEDPVCAAGPPLDAGGMNGWLSVCVPALGATVAASQRCRDAVVPAVRVGRGMGS